MKSSAVFERDQMIDWFIICLWFLILKQAKEAKRYSIIHRNKKFEYKQFCDYS